MNRIVGKVSCCTHPPPTYQFSLLFTPQQSGSKNKAAFTCHVMPANDKELHSCMHCCPLWHPQSRMTSSNIPRLEKTRGYLWDFIVNCVMLSNSELLTKYQLFDQLLHISRLCYKPSLNARSWMKRFTKIQLTWHLSSSPHWKIFMRTFVAEVIKEMPNVYMVLFVVWYYLKKDKCYFCLK